MVDYSGLGARIKAVRKERKMTQEQLAEAAGVGPSHISHIESGTTKLSVPTFIAIINALGCSADKLLCIEIIEAKPALHNWITELFENCNDAEIKLVTDTITAMKKSMRQLNIGEN